MIQTKNQEPTFAFMMVEKNVSSKKKKKKKKPSSTFKPLKSYELTLQNSKKKKRY
jgi:hypothetical protein